jgi:uncharacterized protein
VCSNPPAFEDSVPAARIADPRRRRFLAAALAAPAALSGCDFALQEGLLNACHATLPSELARHPLVAAAWQGLDPALVVDAHCHLFGDGDSGRGPWMNPAMASVLSPARFVQRLFYLNAGCVHDHPGRVDESVVDRLLNQVAGLPAGAKLLLLAFDWARDARGEPLPESSTLHVPDAYARDVARAHPQGFEWAASIHPYDPAALDRLAAARASGALAVKWLPPAQNIDPASPRCDAFYRALAASGMPLITHAGDERAVAGHDAALGNPLKLRRPLGLGVRVIVAHCASLGAATDLDAGANGPLRSAFDLFARLMDEAEHRGRLLGDLSAVAQANRGEEVVATLLERTDWHDRLVNGSDYPLPGVVPLVGLDAFVRRGLLDAGAVPVLRAIRDHNAILFDFVLKRALARGGRRFAAGVFETRRHLATT